MSTQLVPSKTQYLADLAGKAPTLVPTAAKTAAYTAGVGDLAVMNVAGGGISLTLPTAPADKAQVGYRATGATRAVPLTINRGGTTDTIGTAGATSATAVLADEVTVLQYDAINTRWLAVANVKTQASLDLAFSSKVLSNRYRFDSAHFPKWTKALAKVRTGQGDAKLLCVGDSTTAGTGTTLAGTYPATGSWPTRLATILNSYHAPAVPALAVPTSNTTDNRWTYNTGWSKLQQGAGFAGYCAKSATSATGTLIFADPTITADTFDVYYATTGAGTGSFTAQATGGTASATINTNTGTQGIAKVTVTAASAGTGNGVTITPSGNSVFIVGIEPRLSTGARIRVGNAGAPGSSSAEWAGTGGYTSAATIQAYAPDLTIIMLGINDASKGTPPTAAAYAANLQNVIDAAAVSGDVLLASFLPSNGTPWTTYEPNYITAMAGLTNYAYADLFTEVGNWAAWNNLGMMFDALHGNDLAYSTVAKFLFQGLKEV